MLKKLIEKYNKLSKPVKTGAWFFVCSFLQRGISTITTPIFTRLMSTDEYGLYNIYMAWTDFLAIFITFGLSSSVYQKKLVQIDLTEERDRFTSSLQGLATVTTLATFLLYLLFRKPINVLLGLPTNLVISIFIATLATTTFGFWAMRQRVDFEYKKILWITLFTSIAKPLFGIVSILWFPESKVEARAYSLVAVEVLAYFWFYIKHFREGKTFYHKEYWKYAIVFALPLIPHFVSQRILSQSDKLMIKHMVGNSEAGIYSLAHSIGWLLTLFVTALDSTLAPWTYRKLRERDREALFGFSVIPPLFVGFVCLAFILVTPEIVRLFAPAAYHDAIWMVPPLAMSTFFMMLYTQFIYIEYYYEKTKYIMVATVADALLNIVLNYICIKLFGYSAAAYTSLFCYVLYAAFHYLIVRSICKAEFGCSVYNMKAIFGISAAFLTLGLLVTLVYRLVFLRYAIMACILGGLVYKRSAFIGLFHRSDS